MEVKPSVNIIAEKQIQQTVAKPYVCCAYQQNMLDIEVIDGFATGMIQLVKKQFEYTNNQFVLRLERKTSAHFNCYYNEIFNIGKTNASSVKIIISHEEALISETTINL